MSALHANATGRLSIVRSTPRPPKFGQHAFVILMADPSPSRFYRRRWREACGRAWRRAAFRLSSGGRSSRTRRRRRASHRHPTGAESSCGLACFNGARSPDCSADYRTGSVGAQAPAVNRPLCASDFGQKSIRWVSRMIVVSPHRVHVASSLVNPAPLLRSLACNRTVSQPHSPH